MTLFTDNPFEKMMIQRPCGRRDNAPPVFKSPACTSCPYKGQAPCMGYCLKQVQEKQGAKPEHEKTVERTTSMCYNNSDSRN